MQGDSLGLIQKQQAFTGLLPAKDKYIHRSKHSGSHWCITSIQLLQDTEQHMVEPLAVAFSRLAPPTTSWQVAVAQPGSRRGCGVWSWRWINFKTTPKITKCGEHMMKKVSSFGTVIRVEQEKYSLQLLTNSTVQMEVSYNRGIQKWMVSNGRSIYTWMILG